MTDAQTFPTVVLVHGAFADASGYAGVIRELQNTGVVVLAPPNPLRGLKTDAETVRAFVSAIDGPVVLAGHSYGGAVITEASAHLNNVTALVYLAAYAPDEGESCLSATESFPAPPLAANLQFTPYDGIGSAGGPDVYIDRATFREVFCADVPADVADVMAATQRPGSGAALSETCTAAGWKTIPSWFLISAHDKAISPESEHFMAERMKATVETIDGSHVAFIAQPVKVADFIRKAL
jgi:pimeloyl-ACP methyl ester carboxylesterase